MDMRSLVVRQGGFHLCVPTDYVVEAVGAIYVVHLDLHVLFTEEDVKHCCGAYILDLDVEGRIIKPTKEKPVSDPSVKLAQTAFVRTQRKVADAYLNEMDGTIVIVRQYPSNMCYANGVSVPDRVVKETYGIVNGRIGLIQTQEGVHKPSYIVPESVEFPS